jgi:S-layer homology domain
MRGLKSLYSIFTRTMVIALSLTSASIAPVTAQNTTQGNTSANNRFPDTQNHWAQPFIAALAERNIVTGYPDGTYRPTQALERDEFAAIIRQTFSQERERQIASGSVYQDIPENYWAAPAIADAYEMGFLQGYPGGEFRPRQDVSKVDAIVALSQNLNLGTTPTTGPRTKATSPQPSPAATQTQARADRRPMGQWMFPLATTALMQPVVTSIASVIPAVPTPAPTPQASEPETASVAPDAIPASEVVSQYYTDAEQIPKYAVDGVASATRAGVVVNHPEPRRLNPIQPISRGETAALIHQVLVNQGRLNPLPSNTPATNYIVGKR